MRKSAWRADVKSLTRPNYANLLKDLPKHLNHHFFRLRLSLPHFFLDFRFWLIAIAIACF